MELGRETKSGVDVQGSKHWQREPVRNQGLASVSLPINLLMGPHVSAPSLSQELNYRTEETSGNSHERNRLEYP